MISDVCHHASARTVCVVRVDPTADSRTERLRILLTASSNCHHLTHTYVVVDVSGLSKEIPFFFGYYLRAVFISLLVLCGYYLRAAFISLKSPEI